jgi:phosphotransferase system enzyme I (PtsP)
MDGDGSSPVPPHAQLHAQPGGQVERVLNYLAFVAANKPLTVLLDEAPKKIADCVDADVASLYLLEGDGRALVMRGNVGFPKHTRGKVRLTLGEGITGAAVQLRYPISAAQAAEHASYRGFPELGEDRFPAFLAVPVIGTDGPLGAVVVQRGGNRPFTEAEVSLVAALTAPISAGIRLAQLLDDLRETSQTRAGVGTRKVTLPGVPAIAGRAMGAVAALRRPASTSPKEASEEDAPALRTALEHAERALHALADRAHSRGLGQQAAFIDSYLLMIEDQQLRRTTFELLEQGTSLAAALGDVARHATRIAAEGGNEFLINRARDMEQLCDALLMMATPDSRASLPAKAVIFAETISVYDLLISIRAHPVGIVLTECEIPQRTQVLLELLGVPAITDVAGALRWITPGDIALVDGDSGLLIINPSRAEIAALRADRKRDRHSQPERTEP